MMTCRNCGFDRKEGLVDIPGSNQRLCEKKRSDHVSACHVVQVQPRSPPTQRTTSSLTAHPLCNLFLRLSSLPPSSIDNNLCCSSAPMLFHQDQQCSATPYQFQILSGASFNMFFFLFLLFRLTNNDPSPVHEASTTAATHPRCSHL